MDRVAILMGTFNGSAYLRDQLESIERQTHSNWVLWVSDDGSSDNTIDVLRSFREVHPDKVFLLHGPGEGFVSNFLWLLDREEIEADFFAFCDQDDVWHPTKVAKALAWLTKQPSKRPALYCGRTRTVDERGNAIGYSPLFSRSPSFANALVQSIAGGNTMIMNRAARQMIRRFGNKLAVPSHDWWAYITVAGVGGEIYYDPTALIDYRQHASNQVGSNIGFAAWMRRVWLLKEGRFRLWSKQHLFVLEQNSHLFTPKNRELLRLFRMAHSGALQSRISAGWRARFYRQSTLGNAALIFALIFKKV